MADNFRNKQWFKTISQDYKDKLCKHFDIEETTLKKAGRENDEGKIVVDLLRIDHLLHMPSEWDDSYDAIKNHEDFLKSLKKESTPEDSVNIMQILYSLYHTNAKYLKYKNTVHNNVLVTEAYKNVLYDIEDYLKFTDKSDKKYVSNRLYWHLRVILLSDLAIVKDGGNLET